ncbi:MAG: sensor histidine kinase [Spirochaetota bacterium]
MVGAILAGIVIVVSAAGLFVTSRRLADYRSDRARLSAILYEVQVDQSLRTSEIADAAVRFLEDAARRHAGTPERLAEAYLGQLNSALDFDRTYERTRDAHTFVVPMWELYRWYGPFIESRIQWYTAFLAALIFGVTVVLMIGALSFVRMRRIESDRYHARALARNTINVIEIEQRGLMMELHDTIGQQLAMAQMHLSSLEDSRPLETDDQRALRECSSLIADARQSVRNMARRLHPAELEQIGLASALNQLGNEYRALGSPGIEITVREAVERALPKDVQIHVYRVVQEALTNAITHSGATRIEVLLERKADTVWVTVRDDGEGFAYRGDRRSQGFGIMSMTERANIVGGTLAVLSKPGQGTLVSLQLPAEGEAVSESIADTARR